MAYSKAWQYLSNEDLDFQLAHQAAGLTHQERLRIIRYLANHKQATPSAMMRDSKLCLSSMSHHLKMLRDRYLVSSKGEGQHVVYFLNPGVCEMLRDLITDLLDEAIGRENQRRDDAD
ncbi:MAG: helix-turn-helix transcriptional regulator [Saprospiraceae bacterium]|nr:helix-turn-helix transcriptional regulator [Saprospiraceae bacterium]